MKRVILGSLLAFQANAGVLGKSEAGNDHQVLTNIDSNLNKRAFTSPAAAFARSYGRPYGNYYKRSWGGSSKSQADYASIMKSTIEQLKNNLRLLESKTKGLPDQYVAGLISRLGETSRRTMSKLCLSGEVESRLCSLIGDSDHHSHDEIYNNKRASLHYESNLPGQFFMKRAAGLGHHTPLTDDEALFMKRSGLFEDGYLPESMVFGHNQVKRNGMADTEHKLPQFMNYNTFPAGDSINWGSLPGFGAKSAFNMPSKRSIQNYVRRSGEDYSEFLGSLLAKYGPKNAVGAERSLL